jgi:hypothetical protein
MHLQVGRTWAPAGSIACASAPLRQRGTTFAPGYLEFFFVRRAHTAALFRASGQTQNGILVRQLLVPLSFLKVYMRVLRVAAKVTKTTKMRRSLQ